MGSKARIAKDILPFILKNRKENQWYVEPFVGGANCIDKVTGNRLGADNNKYVIALLQSIQEDWNPPPILTEIDYYSIKAQPDKYPEALVGFAAICCSYGGKWWGGYARSQGHYGQNRNHALEALSALKAQREDLKGIIFKHSSYLDLRIPDKSIIYCDPPYRDSTKYATNFDYNLFYSWCKNQKEKGHEIFISEYNMPNEFTCVWEKSIKANIRGKNNDKIERLFIL